MDRRVRSALAAATAVMVTAVLPALSGTAAAITHR